MHEMEQKNMLKTEKSIKENAGKFSLSWATIDESLDRKINFSHVKAKNLRERFYPQKKHSWGLLDQAQ